MTERVSVPEAAKRLGLTEGAVRQRIARGTLDSEKDDDGRVYVYVDRLNTEYDVEQTVPPEHSDVIEILKEQNEYLRSQLEVWQEEARRKDHIIAALTERIPAIEAPSEDISPETRGWREAASEEQDRDSTSQGTAQSREPKSEEQAWWWRRWFGA